MVNAEGQASLPLVIAVVGPTATGKTDVGIELALQLDGEIISCDSRTIYKQMDIGTAKPTLSQQAQANHHLIDIIDPDRFYSIAEYQKTATAVAKNLLANNKLPIVVGGTGLYARALLEGIQLPEIPPQEELRKGLNKLAEEQGNGSLHAKLKELDPVTAERLNVNDKLRVIRALEVCMVAGRPFSQMASKVEPLFETIWIGLHWGDKLCHKDVIAARLKQQFDLGLVEEMQKLFLEPTYRPVLERAINYKEFIPYLERNESLELVREHCILHNLQLARKQMMWFKTNKDITWFAVDKLGLKATLVQILAHCTRRLARNGYTD